jgi:hypothetical protein
MVRRLAMVAAITTGAVGILVALTFPVAVQLQNRALDNCSVHLESRGTVSVHWKSVAPPRYVCAVNEREVKRLPPIR